MHFRVGEVIASYLHNSKLLQTLLLRKVDTYDRNEYFKNISSSEPSSNDVMR